MSIFIVQDHCTFPADGTLIDQKRWTRSKICPQVQGPLQPLTPRISCPTLRSVPPLCRIHPRKWNPATRNTVVCFYFLVIAPDWFSIITPNEREWRFEQTNEPFLSPLHSQIITNHAGNKKDSIHVAGSPTRIPNNLRQGEMQGGMTCCHLSKGMFRTSQNKTTHNDNDSNHAGHHNDRLEGVSPDDGPDASHRGVPCTQHTHQQDGDPRWNSCRWMWKRLHKWN